MNERDIVRALTKLDVDYVGTDGEWCKCRCPLAPYKLAHPKGYDSNPGFGFHIEDDDITYGNCFTCKWTGTVGGLAMLLGKFREEPELIQFGKDLDRQEILGGGTDYEWEDTFTAKDKKADRNTNFPNEQEFEARFASVLSVPAAVAYLAGRGISTGTMFGLGLRFDERQQRVLFPVFDYWTGRYAGCSGRSILSDDTRARIEDRTGKSQPKVRDYHRLQKERLLLHGRGVNNRNKLPRADNGRSILQRQTASTGYSILVEGLFAFARCWQLGYRTDTLAILGSKLLPGKAGIISDIGKPVVWFTDNDAAGDACLYGQWDEEADSYKGGGALDMLYHTLAQFVPEWPEGKDDPDQLTKYEIDRMIEEAELYAKV